MSRDMIRLSCLVIADDYLHIVENPPMGGSGSSRWGSHTKAPTVEMSYVLEVGAFTGPGHDLVDSGVIDLRGKLFAHPLSVSVFIDRVVVPGMLYLSTEFLGRSVTAAIELASEPRHFGGCQVYFRCPGQACGRRAVKLYLPLYRPLGFACRRCHGLTYQTAQQKGTFAGMLRRAPLAEIRQRLGLPG